MTGAAYLELYRNVRVSDPTKAEEYKKNAIEYIRKGPPLAGKQKVMNRELPFDVYIVRKVKKWEERAKIWGVGLADAIGVSPLAEQICRFSYFFMSATMHESNDARSLERNQETKSRRAEARSQNPRLGAN